MTLESASPEQVRGERGDDRARRLRARRPAPSAADGPRTRTTPPTTTPHDLARAICEADPRRPSDVAADAGVARRAEGRPRHDRAEGAAEGAGAPLQHRRAVRRGHRAAISTGGRCSAQPDTLRLPHDEVHHAAQGRRGRRGARRGVARRRRGRHGVAGARRRTASGARRAPVQRRPPAGQLLSVRVPRRHRGPAGIDQGARARGAAGDRSTWTASRANRRTMPSLQRELAAAYEKVGDVQGLPVFANLGDTAGALRSHQSALALAAGARRIATRRIRSSRAS